MKPRQIDQLRRRTHVGKAIRRFDLDLTGLTVFTEAATGNYAYTPVIAALAGARKVFAVAADSKYGTKECAAAQVVEKAEFFGVEKNISVLFEKDAVSVGESDIVTNTGFVRPITEEMVSLMKPTAVIPLMWETWELRPQELDLDACRRCGIVVLGTNEHHPQLDLFRSNGFLICKLLFDEGFDVYKDNLLLVSSGHIGNSAADFFMGTGITFNRVSFDEDVPERQRAHLLDRVGVLRRLSTYDAIVVAELHHDVEIISQDGFIPVEVLRRVNPLVQIIHVCGTVSTPDIVKAGLVVYPSEVAPFGYMTVSPDYLGSKTLIELTTAGLRIGEVATRSRLWGMTVEDTVRYTLRNSPAMDFLATGLEKGE